MCSLREDPAGLRTAAVLATPAVHVHIHCPPTQKGKARQLAVSGLRTKKSARKAAHAAKIAAKEAAARQQAAEQEQAAAAATMDVKMSR